MKDSFSICQFSFVRFAARPLSFDASPPPLFSGAPASSSTREIIACHHPLPTAAALAPAGRAARRGGQKRGGEGEVEVFPPSPPLPEPAEGGAGEEQLEFEETLPRTKTSMPLSDSARECVAPAEMEANEKDGDCGEEEEEESCPLFDGDGHRHVGRRENFFFFTFFFLFFDQEEPELPAIVVPEAEEGARFTEHERVAASAGDGGETDSSQGRVFRRGRDAEREARRVLFLAADDSALAPEVPSPRPKGPLRV